MRIPKNSVQQGANAVQNPWIVVQQTWPLTLKTGGFVLLFYATGWFVAVLALLKQRPMLLRGKLKIITTIREAKIRRISILIEKYVCEIMRLRRSRTQRGLFL